MGDSVFMGQGFPEFSDRRGCVAAVVEMAMAA
jgi:hypothetical protein